MRSHVAFVIVVVGVIVGALGGVGGTAELAPAGAPAPEIAHGAWINSPALTLAGLRGRVVLVEFWTYG